MMRERLPGIVLRSEPSGAYQDSLNKCHCVRTSMQKETVRESKLASAGRVMAVDAVAFRDDVNMSMDEYQYLSALHAASNRSRSAGARQLLNWLPYLWSRPALLGKLLVALWTDCEAPERVIYPRVWVAMFRHAGIVGDARSTAPSEPLTIYRGCTADGLRAMGWTTDVKMARTFAAERHGTTARVYRAEISKVGVLALLDQGNENEVIIDPAYLGDVEVVA